MGVFARKETDVNITKCWYIKDLGMLGRATQTETGVYQNPKLYNQEKKRWYLDSKNILLERVYGNKKQVEELSSVYEIHALEQIDNIALRFAEDAFSGMVDEDGVPVIEHSKAVASKVLTPLTRAVAYLHDIEEDTSYTNEDILRAFGPRMAEIISLLTHNAEDDYVDDYLWFITDDPVASEVKLADLIHNLERDYAHPEKDNAKRIRKHEGGVLYLLWYWLEKGDAPISERLAEIVYSSSIEIQDFVFGHL